jgi:hypothetical protein
MVDSVAALRRGEGIQLVEWSAPAIPPAVLESLEQEDTLAFGGFWGFPQAAHPIQVDIIDIETQHGRLTIEVLNRALVLLHSEDPDVEGLFRLCETLRRAAAGETDALAATPDPTPPRGRRRRSGMRRRPGACNLCGEEVDLADAADHAAQCAPAHDKSAGDEKTLTQLEVTAPGSPPYWLLAEARADATLEALDRFLRGIWLECCGHLSMFRVGNTEYFSRGYDLGAGDVYLPGAGPRPVQRSMAARLEQALPSAGRPFDYEYDFGSTTALHVRVTGERRGRIGRGAVRLLAQNLPIVWSCAQCGAPATLVCSICLGDSSSLVCQRHARRHHCGEEMLLPVVNSPRMGVCGYGAV